MIATEKQEAFYDFLGEYTHFFWEMAGFEQQKLDVLLGNRLTDIEHAISVTQANAMQLDNLEQRRIRMQDEAGLAKMSFAELAETAPEADRPYLRELMDALNSYISDIKFYNTKSMELVQSKLKVQEHSATIQEVLHNRAEPPITLSAKA